MFEILLLMIIVPAPSAEEVAQELPESERANNYKVEEEKKQI